MWLQRKSKDQQRAGKQGRKRAQNAAGSWVMLTRPRVASLASSQLEEPSVQLLSSQRARITGSKLTWGPLTAAGNISPLTLIELMVPFHITIFHVLDRS